MSSHGASAITGMMLDQHALSTRALAAADPALRPHPLQEDLSVAYSPGVAEPCVAIQQNERWAYEYTAKGHLVGVITNGTAVLGLGGWPRPGAAAHGRPVPTAAACIADLLQSYAAV